MDGRKEERMGRKKREAKAGRMTERRKITRGY